MNFIQFEPMDDGDIKHYLPNCKIVLYKELCQINYITQLLPNHKSYIILLYPISSDTNGHWVVVTRYNDTIEFSCSYGKAPDFQLKWCHNNQYQNPPYLTRLFNKSPLHVVYNTIDFQNNNKMISTCGAYCVFRVLTMLEKDMNIFQNNLLLENMKKMNKNKSYDDIVCEYIDYR